MVSLWILKPPCRKMTLFLLLIFVTSARPRKDEKETSRSPFNSPLTAQIRLTQLYQVQKMKSLILRGLNLTVEPTPPTRAPKQKPITSFVVRPPPPRTHRRLFPDAFVWSEPIGAQENGNSDRLLFRITNQNSESDSINRVELVLRLRAKQKRKKRQLKGKAKNKKSTETSNQNAESDKEQTVKRATKKKKKSRRLRRGKTRRVKVLVQAMHEKSGKFKRVAVQRVTVNSRFLRVRLPIPATLVARAVSSANNSLELKVKCKRCAKGKVSIDGMMSPRKKRKRNQENRSGINQRLNTNRPYLVIRKTDTSLESETSSGSSLSRSTRDTENGRCVFTGSRNLNETRCCSHQTRIRIRDLGWEHWILSPSSFTTATCMGYCSGGNGMDNHQMTSDLPQRPTCQALERTPLTVVYQREANLVQRAVIPDILIRSCGCLATT